jgi:hypothetical protein
MTSPRDTGWTRGGTQGFPVFGLATAASVMLLAILAVGERAGMPGSLAWPVAFLIIAGATTAAILASRTAVEPVFLGRQVLARPVPGGLLLGALAAAASFHLLRPSASGDLVATAAGTIAGLAVAHGIARMRRGSPLLIGEAAQGEDGAPSFIQGLLTAAGGFGLMLAALPAARDAMMVLTGWSALPSLLLVAIPPALAIAIGGLRGILTLSAALALPLLAALGIALWLGLGQLGAPPLPGITSDDTLLALAGARSRLFVSDTLPFIVSWLPQGGLSAIVFSLPFAMAATVTALLARGVTPGLPLDEAPTLASAMIGQLVVLLGLAAMAGYAVEAAGLQFVGASLQAPPPGLLEASRQGLAEYCGARPATLDQLRAACGLAPRAQGQLSLDRIRLLEPFLWSGTPVAFGLPSALSAPGRLGPVAFPALAFSAGLWLATQGLGRGVFGRGRIAPGLASHRLGLMRLAALGAAVGAAIVLTLGIGGTWQAVPLVALLALGLDLLQQGRHRPSAGPDETNGVQRAAISRRSRAPRKTAQSA